MKIIMQYVERARAGSDKLAELNAALTFQPPDGANREVPMPRPMPEPLPQAMHGHQYVTVGGVAIGETPNNMPVRKFRGKDKSKRKDRECNTCQVNGGEYFNVCPGRHPRGTCSFFDELAGNAILCHLCVRYDDGRCKEKCIVWNENESRRGCCYFEKDGTPKHA